MPEPLKTIQEELQNSVFQAGSFSNFSYLEGSLDFSKEYRLKIYQEAFFLRLLAVFSEEYPCTQKLLGRSRFTPFVKAFLQTHPPLSQHNIVSVLSEFPTFLKSENPWLPELAQVEWIAARLYFAKNPSPWNMAFLQTLSPEDMGSLHFKKPSHSSEATTELFCANYKILDLWKTPKKITPQFQPEWGPEHFVLYRYGFQIKALRLSQKEFELLNQFYSGVPLETLLEKQGSLVLKKISKWGPLGILFPVHL